MANIGPTELLIFVAVIAVLAAFLIGVARRSTSGPAASAPRPRLDPAELHHQVTGLIAAGKTVQAVKLVREQTGLGLADAKRYTDDLAAGRPPHRAFHPGATAPGPIAAPQPASATSRPPAAPSRPYSSSGERPAWTRPTPSASSTPSTDPAPHRPDRHGVLSRTATADSAARTPGSVRRKPARPVRPPRRPRRPW